jgi:hypothetical protein
MGLIDVLNCLLTHDSAIALLQCDLAKSKGITGSSCQYKQDETSTVRRLHYIDMYQYPYSIGCIPMHSGSKSTAYICASCGLVKPYDDWFFNMGCR